MLRLLEDLTKAWLGSEGFPTPRGGAAASSEEAGRIATELGGDVVVKALVPAGRRGKDGAVKVARNASDAAAAAAALLGRSLAGTKVNSVYVEERIGIASELYLAFVLSSERPRVLISAQGGVDIEETSRNHPGTVICTDVDPLAGLSPWEATRLWKQAGVEGPVLRDLGTLTSRLFDLFQRNDVLLLEINPLAVDRQDRLCLVGAMAGIDDNAVRRHPRWSEASDLIRATAMYGSDREREVAELDATLPGGECRYVELAGDIGLLVGGGGAGLYQHDLVIRMGGEPANHCVTPPTGRDNRKLAGVIRAILRNPNARGLLVGFNFAQMARADLRAETLAQVLDEIGLDTATFPIVLRLFGAGEEQARAVLASRPGIHYLPRGATLEDGVRAIVELVRLERAKAAA